MTDTIAPSYADRLVILEVPISWSPKDPYRLVKELFYLHLGDSLDGKLDA
jgi:hypothetical protein